MVVDVGVVKNRIKPKEDSTLYNMRKVDLIEYIRTLEHNYNVAVSFNENQAKYIESLGFTGGTVQKWIPVTERLPERDGKYLCNYHFGEHRNMTFTQMLDYYATDKAPHFQHENSCGMKVSHWMPLPEPPKGE